MSDLADRAEWLTEAERADGVARVRLAMLPSPVFDCAACGDPIEPERKAAMPAARRCTPCEGSVERFRRQRAGGVTTFLGDAL